MAAGHAPGRHELSKIVGHLEQLAATRAAQALLRGGRDDERRAEGYVRVLGGLRAIHAGATSPDEELTERLMKFQLKTEPTPMVSVDDLRRRGDDVTTDVVPAVEPGMPEGEAFGDEEIDLDGAGLGQ